MGWTPKTRYAAAVLAGAVAAAAILVVVGSINSRYPGVGGRSGSALCTGLSPFGWITPFLIVGVVAASGWLLVRSVGSASLTSRVDDLVCPGCGEHMLEGWRLCPYCGKGITPSDSHDPDAEAGEADDRGDGTRGPESGSSPGDRA